MLLSVWGHIHSIPTVGTQTDHNNHPHTQFAAETRKWAEKEKCLQYRSSPNPLVLNDHKSMKQFVEIHSLRPKVRHSLNPLLPFSPAENGFSGSFEKLSTVQLTCSEGALFPIHGNEECAIN